jgi:hypothetical protein
MSQMCRKYEENKHKKSGLQNLKELLCRALYILKPVSKMQLAEIRGHDH